MRRSAVLAQVVTAYFVAAFVVTAGLVPFGAASRADAPAVTDPNWGLQPLMDGLRQVKSASAHFVEHKYVAMLTKPLETSGTLHYVAPDQLEKLTLTPKPESFILNGDTLSGTRSNGDHFSVALSEHPEIGALVEGVRATMAGDLPALSRYYKLVIEGSRAEWRLWLLPKTDAMREKIDAIRIVGSDYVLRTIEIRERDGDRSEMIVTPDAS
jgi:hypothetical protein